MSVTRLHRMVTTYTTTAPAHWASYIVNDDPTSLDEDDITACDRWLASLDGPVCGVAEGEFFTHYHDAFAYLPLGATCVEYVVAAY